MYVYVCIYICICTSAYKISMRIYVRILFMVAHVYNLYSLTIEYLFSYYFILFKLQYTGGPHASDFYQVLMWASGSKGSNKAFFFFFDTLVSRSIYPQITLHTRFTRTNGTLIYNVVCKLSKYTLESTTGILTKQFSNHQPYVMLLNVTQVIESPPKFTKNKLVSEQAMTNVKYAIRSDVLYNKLNVLEVLMLIQT